MSSTSVSAVSRARFFGATADTHTTYAMALLLVLLVAAAVRLLFFPGPSGTDDVVYAARALELARGFWQHSTALIDLRFGITLPVSFFARLFPGNEVALAGWPLLCSLTEVGLVFVVAHRLWGLPAAISASVVLAFVPMHIILGARPLGDAPLAAMFSIAFCAAFLAIRTGRTVFYVIAGVAVGFSWWVKPVAFVPFMLALAAYVALERHWRRQWLLAGVACAGVILLEWIVLWIHFNDPFISIRANFAGVTEHFIQRGAPWGSHSPWFYFLQLWVDGRDMWIVPHLAVAGLIALAITAWRRGTWDSGRTFACCWFLGLLFTFSFFIYSIDPVKIIPKQQNYALIFAAPIALLAGYALSLLQRNIRILAILVVVVGGLFLAAVEQQAIRNTASRIFQTIEFASLRPDHRVFVSSHVLNMAKLQAALSGAPAPVNLVSLRDLTTGPALEGLPRLVAIEPLAPESQRSGLANRVGKLIDACGRHLVTVESKSGGIGRPFVLAIRSLREFLPYYLEHQLRFTNHATHPPGANIYSLREGCSTGA